MARKDIFAGLNTEPTKREAKPAAYHGAARSLVDSIEELASRANGGGVLELEPSIIDPSPFPDRLPDDDEQPFEDFKRSVSEEGQKVPIQVRPHPTADGRYQVTYGHRRLRAAKELGRPVKALVVDTTDAELVVAQGLENAARQDLSWIEKALFARRMEEAGVKPRDIYAALSIERTELAKMRRVWNMIPVDFIELIGRASKGGRPRWQELAKWVDARPEKLVTVRKMLAAATGAMDSNQKLQIAIDGFVSDESSRVSATVVERKLRDLGTIKFIASTTRGREFANFIEAQIPGLVEQFEQGEN